MKKILIEGINGSLELNEKYIYLVLKNIDSDTHHEHIIWFDEIEDVIYKKPTRESRGFISLYLSTKSFITNRKKIYILLLERIDEKSLETNNKLYSILKEIIDNKEVKVVEAKDEELSKEEQIKEDNEEKEPFIEEVINEYNKVVSLKEHEVRPVVIPNTIPSQEKEEQNLEKRVEEPTQDIINEEEQSVKQTYRNVSIEEIEDNVDVKLEESFEEGIVEEEKEIKTLGKLEQKIKELEKELQELTYKEIIIGEYVDETINRKKIDKLIIEIKKLIDKINKMKKEINKYEKVLNGNEFIKLDNGNVTVLSISKSLLDEAELKKFVESYKRTVRDLNQVQDETTKLKEETDEKRKNIGITDEDYERRINQFRGVKENKEIIGKLIAESKEDLSRVKWRIETSIEPRVRFKIVHNGISRLTKRLMMLNALNGVRPNHSRTSMMALTFATGASLMSEFFGFEIKRETYNEIVQKEFLEGLENIDTKKARLMLLNSKDQIEDILADCEKKYKDFPQFESLRKNLLNMKADIEKQDKELSAIEDKVVDYKLGPKVKTLRYNQQ